jgi:hypothetical protein
MLGVHSSLWQNGKVTETKTTKTKTFNPSLAARKAQLNR